MAIPTSDAMPTYVIYRDTQPGQLLDLTQPPVFFPPKDSDELFDALRAKFPHVKTHSERMRDAIIEFLIEERQTEQMNSANTTAASPLSQSWQSITPSSLSSPDTLMSSTPLLGNSPLMQSQSSMTSRNPSTGHRECALTSSEHSIEQMTTVFSLSTSEQPKQRIRRKMTDAEKVEYRKRRIVKACESCVKRKRKCHHNQLQMDHTSAKTHKITKNAAGSSRTSPFESSYASSKKPHALNIRDDPGEWFDDIQPFEDFTTLLDEPDADFFNGVPPYVQDWQWPVSGDFTLLDQERVDMLDIGWFQSGDSSSGLSSSLGTTPQQSPDRLGTPDIRASPAIGQAGDDFDTLETPTGADADPSAGMNTVRRSGGIAFARRSGGIAMARRSGGIPMLQRHGGGDLSHGDDVPWNTEHLRIGQPGLPNDIGTHVSPELTRASRSNGTTTQRLSGTTMPNGNGLLWEHLRTGQSHSLDMNVQVDCRDHPSQSQHPRIHLEVAGFDHKPQPRQTRHARESSAQGQLSSQAAVPTCVAESSLRLGQTCGIAPSRKTRSKHLHEKTPRDGSAGERALLRKPCQEADSRHLGYTQDRRNQGEGSFAVQGSFSASFKGTPAISHPTTPSQLLRSGGHRSEQSVPNGVCKAYNQPRTVASAHATQISASQTIQPPSISVTALAPTGVRLLPTPTVALLLLACAAILSLASMSPSVLLLAAITPVVDSTSWSTLARASKAGWFSHRASSKTLVGAQRAFEDFGGSPARLRRLCQLPVGSLWRS